MKRQEVSVEKLLDIIEEKERRIAELEQQVQWFMEQIRLSKRKQSGASSEQTKIEQINLFNEEEESHDLAISEPQRIEVLSKQERMTKSDIIKGALNKYFTDHEKKCRLYELGEELFHQFGSGKGDLTESYKKKLREKNIREEG